MRYIYLLLLVISFPGVALATNEVQKGDICRAVISVEMGRDFKTIKYIGDNPEGPKVSYRRPVDNNEYIYGCKFEGDLVYWRPWFGKDEGNFWGRWRDDPSEYDIIYLYNINGKEISLDDGFGNIRKFTVN